MSFVSGCLPQMVPNSSQVIFNFNHSYFFMSKGGMQGASGLSWGMLPLDWSGPFLFLYRIVTCVYKALQQPPSSPVLQRCLYFHAEGEGWHWWKVCRKTWNPKQRKCGLARVVIDLELESKILDLWFLIIWDNSLMSETKGEVYTNKYPHFSPLYIWGGGMGSSQDVQPPLKHKRRKVKRGYFNEL